MKNNERNAGRKKKNNVAYTVRCDPKVIDKVRDFAKTESEKLTKNTGNALIDSDFERQIITAFNEGQKYIVPGESFSTKTGEEYFNETFKQ